MTACRTILALAILTHAGLLLVGDGQAGAAEPAAKLPVPSAQQQKKVLNTLGEVFDLDKKRNDREMIDLANKVYKMAGEVKGRPAERFTTLRKAMELAGDGGDAALMVEIVSVIGAEFQIDALTVQGKMLNAFADNANSTERIESLVGAARTYVHRAVAAEKFDYALSIAALANRVSQRPAGKDLRKEAFELRPEVERLRREHEQLLAARKTLEANPDDPAAHLAVGSAICFGRGDWKGGLPHLSRGSDPELAALAKREIDAPGQPVDQARLADGWWAVAQTRKGRQKKTLLLHAGDWYEKAEPAATGLTKVKVDKRLAELAELTQAEARAAGVPASASIREKLVDLLPMIDPKKDAIAGTWQIEDGQLIGGGHISPLITLPIQPPPEYDLEFQGKWINGSGEVVVVLLHAKGQVRMKIHAYHASGTLTGLEAVDGKILPTTSSPTRFVGKLIEQNTPYTVKCSVRRTGIRIEVNGKTVAGFQGDPARLALRQEASTPQEGTLAVGAWNSVNIYSKIKLRQVTGYGKPIVRPRAPAMAAGGSTTIYWLMADDMDIYQNGTPLREYTPSFRTRGDEARKKTAYSAKINLRPGDVFTIGGRRGGSYGGTVVVVDKNNKLVWCSNTNDWRVYEPADAERWFLPEVAKQSKLGPVQIAKSFGYQAQMRRNYNGIPQPIWGKPSQRVVYMVGVYGRPKPGAKPTGAPRPLETSGQMR